MKTTRYFDEQVLRKRPEITVALCEQVLTNAHRRQAQADGSVRHWAQVMKGGEASPRWLRVVTLDDGLTIHNAFFDRGYREDAP